MKKEKAYLDIKNMSTQRKIIILFLSFLFSMLAVGGIQLDKYSELRISVSACFVFVILFALHLVILYTVYSHLDSISDMVREKEAEGMKRREEAVKNAIARGEGIPKGPKGFFGFVFRFRFLISFFILGFFYTFHFLGLYPGIFAFDSRSQYLSYLNNNMSEFHPILHTVMLGSIIKAVSKDPYSINHGVAVFVIIQTFLCVIAFALTASYVFKKTRRINIFIFSNIVFGFYPPIVWEVLSVTKDTYFLIFFMFSTVLSLLLFEMVNLPVIPPMMGNNATNGPETEKGDSEPIAENPFDAINKRNKIMVIVIAVLLGITITGMCIFRNNCIYAIPFFIVPLFFVIKKKKYLVALTTGVFLLLFLCYKLLFVPAFVNYKPDGREMYSVPIQQMIAVYTDENGVLSDDDKAMIERLIPEEGRVYIPSIADIPKSCIDMVYYKENKKAVREMYFRLLKNNPKKSYEAFLSLNCGLWTPGLQLTLYPDGTKGFWPIKCFEPAVMNSKLPFLYEANQNLETYIFAGKWSMIAYLIDPGSLFWFFMTYVGFVVEKKRFKFFPVFIFMIAYFATFLLGPVSLVRYVVFLYAILPLYLTIFSNN